MANFLEQEDVAAVWTGIWWEPKGKKWRNTFYDDVTQLVTDVIDHGYSEPDPQSNMALMLHGIGDLEIRDKSSFADALCTQAFNYTGADD